MNYYNKNKNILYRYRLSRVGVGCCKAEGLHCVSVCTRWRADMHQQNTLFWTVLDRATQIHRAHSLVHSGQVCPDTHSLWVPVQLCPDIHSYELLSSSGQYNPNSSIILPFITRLS